VLSVHSGVGRPQSITRGGAVGAAGGSAAGGAGAGAGAGGSDVVREGDAPIDEKTLKRFIQFTRSHCFPRLEEQSAGRLVAKYVELRDKVRGAWAWCGV
jgi:DNA replicative helicase MCM subunit Mcm2 (Cdc46/Mcm family)